MNYMEILVMVFLWLFFLLSDHSDTLLDFPAICSIVQISNLQK